jgi:hypothetical protein
LEQLQLFDINIKGTLFLCRRPFHELTGFIVCAEPEGPLGFLNAVNELFRRSGKSTDDIKRAGGRPEWFDSVVIPSGKTFGQGCGPERNG